MKDRLKPLLVNRYETITDQQLREVAASRGMRVCPKVGFADVVNIEGSGIADDEYTYALKAHLDFVVADDSERARPLFAVEFDEPHHRTDPRTIRRDRMKNALCQRFQLPLLRIDQVWLEPIRRWTVLKWIIDVQGLYDSWIEEQTAGRIPWDEDFYWPFIIETDQQGRIVDRPYDLAAGAMNEMAVAFRDGVTLRHVTETVSDEDEEGYTVAYGILPLTAGGYVIETARCWSFKFPPVSPRELADDLTMIAVSLKRYRAGQSVPHSDEQLGTIRERTKGWCREGALLNDIPYP